MATGEFAPKIPATGADALGTVTIAGQEIDIDAEITAAYTVRPDTVDVLLPLRGKAVVRQFKTYPRKAEYDAMVAHAVGVYKDLPEPDSPAQKVHRWAECWPQSPEEFIYAYLVAELSINPKLPIETALVWLRHPTLIAEIISQIEGASCTLQKMWKAALVTVEKKGSKETSTDSTNSESAVDSVDTQTISPSRPSPS